MPRKEAVAVDGRRVQYIRRQIKGWTQEMLEAECEKIAYAAPMNDPVACSRGTIQNIERGRPALPSRVRCIAIALGVPYEQLLQSKTFERPDAGNGDGH